MKKFEMGPIQKEWVKSLREHPERQMRDTLGSGSPDNYKACCLGELHIIGCKMLGQPAPFHDRQIYCGSATGCLSECWETYGLHNATGGFEGKPYEFGARKMASLATMNDAGISWTVIADFIEQNQERVFTKSV